VSRRTALRLASGFFDWAAAFLLLVAVFLTFDGHAGASLGFVGIGLVSTFMARVAGGLASDA
jgi:hypothetical protein